MPGHKVSADLAIDQVQIGGIDFGFPMAAHMGMFEVKGQVYT
jgi:hypothetical protein